MSDNGTNTRLRQVRDELGLSREMVVRRPELQPPITTKTLERWERGVTPVKGFRYQQLASIYQVKVAQLREERAAA